MENYAPERRLAKVKEHLRYCTDEHERRWLREELHALESEVWQNEKKALKEQHYGNHQRTH